MTENEFDEFLDTCYQELEEKQALLFEKYNIGAYERYFFDQETGSIQFSNNGKVELEFIVIPIGSWSGKSNSWMWAWANESLIDEFKSKSFALKGLTQLTEFTIFENEAFEAQEGIAHELTSMAVHYLDAMGMYIVPSGKLKSFFALMSVK